MTSIHNDNEFDDTFGSEADDRTASGQSNDPSNDRDAEEEIDANDRHLIAIDEALATRSYMPSFPDSIDTECNPDWARQMSLIQLLRKTLPETSSTSESNAGPKSLQLHPGSEMIPEHALGHFQLIRLLGYGGCGMVYLAKDPRNDRCIALKVPRPDILLQPGMQLRFINEARAAALLSHSNIASVYEVGDIDGMAYFTAQYCEGGSLAEWLATRDRPPTTKVSASIIAHLADAIEFAHCRGVLHRDIKPNNILLTRRLESDADPIEGFEWTPKLIDFGLAKVSGEDLTRTGDMIGTLRYMAPEMIGNRGDSRSDVYGLGMTLYEILLGSPAYDAVDQAQLLHQVTQGTPVRPSKVRPDVTRDLETIVLKSIDPDPERRYQHAGALGDDLRRFLNNYPIQARAVGSCERGYLWCRRNRVLAMLISIACIACCATVIVSVTMAVLQYRAYNNLRVAQQQTAEMATELAWDQGRRLCKEGQIGIGLLWLGRALETAPKSSVGYGVAIRTEIASWLDRCVALRWSFHHPNAVNAVAYSSDGKLLLAGGADGVATIWNIETGVMHRQWNAHASAIHSVSFYDDDSQALTSCLDGDVKRWKFNDKNAEVLSVLSHPADVRVVRCNEGSKGFVTGCEDGQVRFWNQEGQADGTSIQADGEVVAIDFNASGKTIAVAYLNKETSRWEVGFWDLENRSRLPQRLHCRRRFRSVRYSPDDKFLLTGDDDWEANLWHADSGELYATLLQDGNASSVDFSPDSANLIVACEDTASVNTLEIKQIETLRKQNGVFVHRFGHSSLLHRSRLLQAKFSPDARSFVSTCAEGLIRVWAPGKPMEPIRKWTFPKSLTYVTLSVAGDRMVVAEIDGTVTWINLTDIGEQASTKMVHSKRLTAIALASNGRQLMTGCADGFVRIWDCEFPKQMPTEIPMGTAVDALALCNDRRELFVACGNGGIRKLDLDSNEWIEPHLDHAPQVNCFAVSTDENSIACGTTDGEVIVRDTGTLQTRYIRKHRGRINSLAYSREGSKLVSTSSDGTAIVWEAETGLSISTLSYGRDVNSARFYGNDEFVLLAGFDGEASLWSVETGKRVGVSFPHPNFITRCVVDYAKNEALTACGDGSVRGWPLPQAMSIESNRVTEFLQNRTGLHLTRKGAAILYDPVD